jgi:hypothetical protein
VSDKLKGRVAKYTVHRGSTSGPRGWGPQPDAHNTGKGKITGNFGSYVPTGTEVDGDLTPSSSFKTHRGVLEGGDRRQDDGASGKRKQTRKLKGNAYV